MSLNTVNVVNNPIPAASVQPNTQSPLPGGNLGEALLSELQARYSVLCRNGAVYAIDSDAVTVAAANTTKGAAGTIKLINGVYNPLGSGMNIHILLVESATVSGTPAGPLFYNAQTLPANVSLTNAVTGVLRSTLTNTLAGATNGVSPNSIVPEVNVVLVRSDAATTAFTQTGVHGGPAAIAAGAGMYSNQDEVAGKIIVPPGAVWGLTAVGAGTSHVVQTTIYFAVLPA